MLDTVGLDQLQEEIQLLVSQRVADTLPEGSDTLVVDLLGRGEFHEPDLLARGALEAVWQYWNPTLGAVNVETAPFPGFPTDLQAQWMALMTIADGISLITERIYPDRWMHLPELLRLGADLDTAVQILLNAKVQRPGVCNAAEKLLVHKDVAVTFLPVVVAELRAAGVEVRGDAVAREIMPDLVVAGDDHGCISSSMLRQMRSSHRI